MQLCGCVCVCENECIWHKVDVGVFMCVRLFSHKRNREALCVGDYVCMPICVCVCVCETRLDLRCL